MSNAEMIKASSKYRTEKKGWDKHVGYLESQAKEFGSLSLFNLWSKNRLSEESAVNLLMCESSLAPETVQYSLATYSVTSFSQTKFSSIYLKLREAICPQRWKRWAILNCHILLYFNFYSQISWNRRISLLCSSINHWRLKPHFIPCSAKFTQEEHIRDGRRL